jgi:glycosyltransferase involved in cell wall biosynthesis
VKLSVIIPAHNCQSTIRDSVESLLPVSDPDSLEIVIVENGSSDQTQQEASQLAAENDCIKLLTLPEPSLVDALNTGLKQSAGELIGRMDADDISKPGRLDQQIQFLDYNPQIQVCATQVEYSGTGKGFSRYVEWQNDIISSDDFLNNRFVEAPLVHPTVMFRREIADQFGSWRKGDYPEDFELWLRWLEAGVQFQKIPKKLLTWVDSSDRLSRTDLRYSQNSFLAVRSIYLLRWIKSQNLDQKTVLLWGAGKQAKRRAQSLCRLGLEFDGWIDVDRNKQGRSIFDRPIYSEDQLKSFSSPFVISLLAESRARQLVSEYLTKHGLIPLRDYVLAA